MTGHSLSLSPQQLSDLLPLAAQWAEQQEAHILAHGVALSPSELADAQAVGVRHPERVRVLTVQAIPTPEHPVLRAASAATGLISPATAGLSLRYGIYIRADCDGDRFLVAHELAHTAQYERLGGFAAFLGLYLHECITIGYPAAPMEQEAIHAADRLRRS